MTPDKMSAARSAIDRFIYDLLGKDDELFFMEFASAPRLMQDWTTDRRADQPRRARVDPDRRHRDVRRGRRRAADRRRPARNRKKALLVISDGNDTNSATSVGELRQQIRESEVLVYALGVDGTGDAAPTSSRPPVQIPLPIPFPVPGRAPAAAAAARRSAAAAAAVVAAARPASA